MSWWAVGTAVGSAIHKNINDAEASKRAADNQKQAAEKARQDAIFRPYDVQGAFGTANIDNVTGQASIELTPEMQQVQDAYQQQALQFANQGQTQLGEQASALGTDFLGQINADPYAAAESQFAKMEEILNPARQRQREALESRLLRQGRLGSTGGALQQQSYESAVEESRQKGLYDALAQSQAMQSDQARLGTALGSFGQDQENVGFNQAQARLGGLGAIDTQALAYLNLGSSLGGRQSTAGAQAGAFGMQGANAQTALQLGQAAGTNQAINTAGSALQSYFKSNNTNNYSGEQGVDRGSEQDTMLAEQNKGFY